MEIRLFVYYNRVLVSKNEYTQYRPSARLEGRLFAQLFVRVLLLSLTRAKLANNTTFLPLTPQNPLVDTEPFESHGPPGMCLPRRDTDFCTETIPLAVGETSRRIPEHVGRGQATDKGACVFLGWRDDRVGVMR